MIVNFALQPFPTDRKLPQIEINGRVSRKGNNLSIEYQLFGDLNAISIAPPANMYDFTFLAPCPSSGIIVNGLGDEIVTSASVSALVSCTRIPSQRERRHRGHEISMSVALPPGQP